MNEVSPYDMQLQGENKETRLSQLVKIIHTTRKQSHSLGENMAALLKKFNFTYKSCSHSVSVVTGSARSLNWRSLNPVPASVPELKTTCTSSHSRWGLFSLLEAFSCVKVSGCVLVNDIAVVVLPTATLTWHCCLYACQLKQVCRVLLNTHKNYNVLLITSPCGKSLLERTIN